METKRDCQIGTATDSDHAWSLPSKHGLVGTKCVEAGGVQLPDRPLHVFFRCVG